MRSVFGAIEVQRAYALRNDFVSCKAVGRWPVAAITGTLPAASEGDAVARLHWSEQPHFSVFKV